MKLRISRKIRAARRRAAHTSAPATISTGLLAQVLYPSPTLTLECRDAFQRFVETINRMAFIGICKTKKTHISHNSPRIKRILAKIRFLNHFRRNNPPDINRLLEFLTWLRHQLSTT